MSRTVIRQCNFCSKRNVQEVSSRSVEVSLNGWVESTQGDMCNECFEIAVTHVITVRNAQEIARQDEEANAQRREAASR